MVLIKKLLGKILYEATDTTSISPKEKLIRLYNNAKITYQDASEEKLTPAREQDKVCKKHNIDTIDTSPDYKNAETLIGEAGSNPFKVITKMPDIKKVKTSGEGYFKDTITNSLESLKCY